MSQQKNEELGHFVNCAKKLVPVPEYREAEVRFDINNGLFLTYVDQLHENLGPCQGMPVPSKQEIIKLLVSLLSLRIAYVRGERLPFSIRGTKFCIPAFFSQILTNIGRVESDEFGLLLKPAASPVLGEDGKELSLEQVAQTAFSQSRKLRPFFEVARITYSTELPRPKEGNISLMTLQVIDQCVKAESNRSEPIFALMAAVLCNEIAKEVVLPRINYGALTYLKTLILQVGDYERSSS